MEGAKKLLVEEAQREKEEKEQKQKEEEEIIKRELVDKERKKEEKIVEELKGKEYEDIERETLEQSYAQDNPNNPLSTSGEILTEGHLLIAKLGLVHFTTSKKHAVASLDKVFFDHKRKVIV